MKKIIISIAVLSIISGNSLFAQFTVYTPPVSFNISDLEYNETQGELVIASEQGVYFFDGSNWTATTAANGLPSNNILCVATSTAGAVLTGTDNGLANWNGSSWDIYTLNTAESYSFISSIYIHQASDTLYGTDNGKMLQKSAAAMATNVSFNPSIGLFTHIGYMNHTGAFDLIIGTTNNGAVIYDLPTTQTFVVNTGSTPIPSNNIISHDIEGNFTYDGTDQGVYIADFTNMPSFSSSQYNTGNSQLPSNIIQAVAVRNGVQWYGTPNGLAKLDGAVWTIYNSGNSNLPNDDVVELTYDKVGDVLWIGTGDGLISKIEPSLSVEDIPSIQTNILVYPNPSVGVFTIESKNIDHLVVTNIEGKVIKELNVQDDKLTLDLGEQSNGIYFVKVWTALGVHIEKLILE